MKRHINITYQWWPIDGKPVIHSYVVPNVNKEHESELEECAKTRIDDMKAQGYKSGELLATIDDTEYKGWFEIQETSE